MNTEHVWASSQSATAEAGQHRYITLLATTVPSALIATTQMGGISAVSSGSGYEVYACAVTAGTTAGGDVQLTFVGGLNIGKGAVASQTTGDGLYYNGTDWIRRGDYLETLIKGWVNFDGSSFSGDGDDDYNVDSITDGGVGEYTIVWGTDFAAGTYSVVAQGRRNHVRCLTPDTGSVGITTADDNHNFIDSAYVSVMAIGDQ